MLAEGWLLEREDAQVVSHLLRGRGWGRGWGRGIGVAHLPRLGVGVGVGVALAHRRVELAQSEVAAAARDVKARVRVHDGEADAQRRAVGAQLQARRALGGRGLVGRRLGVAVRVRV